MTKEATGWKWVEAGRVQWRHYDVCVSDSISRPSTGLRLDKGMKDSTSPLTQQQPHQPTLSQRWEPHRSGRCQNNARTKMSTHPLHPNCTQRNASASTPLPLLSSCICVSSLDQFQKKGCWQKGQMLARTAAVVGKMTTVGFRTRHRYPKASHRFIISQGTQKVPDPSRVEEERRDLLSLPVPEKLWLTNETPRVRKRLENCQ